MAPGVGSAYTLDYNYPVTADLDLELLDPSGAKVASATGSTQKPESPLAILHGGVQEAHEHLHWNPQPGRPLPAGAGEAFLEEAFDYVDQLVDERRFGLLARGRRG